MLAFIWIFITFKTCHMLRNILLAVGIVLSCSFTKVRPVEHVIKPLTTFTISANNISDYLVVAIFHNIGGSTYAYTVPTGTSNLPLVPMPSGNYTVSLQEPHSGHFYYNFNKDIHCSLPFYNSGTVTLKGYGFFLTEMPLC